MLERGIWLNEPPHWNIADDALHVTTGPEGDFWRHTYYGFVHDSGHVLAVPVSAHFTAQVFVEADFQHLYEQAGLMLRASPEIWCKAGVEFSDGERMIGSVLTQGQSDWATCRMPEASGGFWVRMTLKNGVLRVQYSTDGHRWPLLRLCPFPAEDGLSIGPMCCSPQGEGLRVTFRHFSVGVAQRNDLHDLS